MQREIDGKTIRWDTCLVWAVGGVSIALTLARCFNNSFWGDEGWSIRLANQSLSQMIASTASDVHPPLYYLWLMLFRQAFGNVGFAYHFASVAAYILIVLFFATAYRREFGAEASVVAIVCATLLDNAVTYNLEVRMYSLASLMVLLSFWEMYRIIRKGGQGGWVLLALFSLGAAYTHYYGLVIVSSFYLILLVRSIWRRCEDIPRWLMSAGLAIVGYLPWLRILLGSFERTREDFWMTERPGVRECLEFVFARPWVLWAFIVLACLLFLYDSGMLRVKKERDDAQDGSTYSVCFNRHAFSWQHMTTVPTVASALLTLAFTIAVGEVTSIVIRPMFLTRYLFPLTSVIWFCLGACLSRTYLKKLWAALLVATLLIATCPNVRQTIADERSRGLSTAEVQAAVASATGESSMPHIYTNDTFLDWTLLDYYYPGVAHTLVASEGDLAGATESADPLAPGDFLFWSVDLDDPAKDTLALAGLGAAEVARGNVGDSYAVVYQVVDAG